MGVLSMAQGGGSPSISKIKNAVMCPHCGRMVQHFPVKYGVRYCELCKEEVTDEEAAEAEKWRKKK